MQHQLLFVCLFCVVLSVCVFCLLVLFVCWFVFLLQCNVNSSCTFGEPMLDGFWGARVWGTFAASALFGFVASTCDWGKTNLNHASFAVGEEDACIIVFKQMLAKVKSESLLQGC